MGLLEGSIQATQFYEWEEEHNLKLQHVSLTGFEDAMDKLSRQKIDCLVSTETPQLVETGMSATFVIGGANIYFAVNRDRTDLKEELDSAMRKIQSNRPFYADEFIRRREMDSFFPIRSGRTVWKL